MALVSLDNAHFDYGREKILRGVNIALHPGVMYALVGANGAGKTTLLSVIAGEIEMPSGVRQTMGRVKIRFLRQETTLHQEGSEAKGLAETVAREAFGQELALERTLGELAHQIADTDDVDKITQLAAEQGKLQAEFERLNGYTIKARLESALRGVGLFPESWNRTVDQLSGGERRRAALATVLLSGADLLLLDEPTNHLDLESCEWLEGYLGQYPGAVVVVSHDRQFLDKVVTRTLQLDRGKLVSYSGNYSFFDEQSALRYEQDLNAWQRQQTTIRLMDDYIRKNIEGQQTKQAQARRKQLDKLERLEKPGAEPGLFRFHLTPVRESGGTVMQLEGLGKSYEHRPLLQDLDLHVSKGDRIGIVGPNGCGKSTLLKMMAGRIFPDAGRIVIGHHVDLGFYDQELSSVSDHNTVLGEMIAVDPRATLGEHRSFLGAFGFGEDLFDRQVGRLSGGERGRLALLRLIKEGHNTLLLDEPTNHLDIRSRESLEAALIEFSGSLVVVSHDRRFLNKIVDRLVIFPSVEYVQARSTGQIKHFLGNYNDLLRHNKAAQEAAGVKEGAKISSVSSKKGPKLARADSDGFVPLSKNERKRRQEWLNEVEETILELEAEKDEVLSNMSSAGLDNQRRLDLAQRCATIDEKLGDLMTRWEQLSLQIEQGMKQE